VILTDIFSLFGQIMADPDADQFDNATRYIMFRTSYWRAFNKVKVMNRDFAVRFFQVAVPGDFIDQTLGLLTYELPPELETVIRVEKQGGTVGGTDGNPMIPIVTVNEKDYYYNVPSGLPSSREVVFFLGQKLGIKNGIPGGTWRVFYVRRWPELHTGTATAGGASTITFPVTPTIGTLIAQDDYYKDAIIRITGGTGSGQERRITTYVASTRIATVSVAWTTPPDVTSTYSLVPEFPENHHDILAYEMAKIGYQRRGNQAMLQVIAGELAEQYKDLASAMKVRQDQEPRPVIDIEEDYF